MEKRRYLAHGKIDFFGEEELAHSAGAGGQNSTTRVESTSSFPLRHELLSTGGREERQVSGRWDVQDRTVGGLQQDWKVEFQSAEEGRGPCECTLLARRPNDTRSADVQKRGLDYFRRVVALVYSEVGVLKASNHQFFASKANVASGFFGPNRKAQAKQLYKQSLTDVSITETLGRYAKRTGLTLEDAHEVFREGNWRLASGICAFGGSNWVAIVSVAIQLGLAIQGQVWPEVTGLQI